LARKGAHLHGEPPSRIATVIAGRTDVMAACFVVSAPICSVARRVSATADATASQRSLVECERHPKLPCGSAYSGHLTLAPFQRAMSPVAEATCACPPAAALPVASAGVD